MRKLLLSILAPIFVFGVMGCNQIDPGVQTDEMIQGGWVFEDGDYFLYISAAQMSVKYITDVVTPYRTEFSRGATVPALGGAVTDRYSKADGTEIKGEMTLFNYKENIEIAVLELILTIDKEDPKNNILEIVTVTYSEPEYYYAYAMPRVGLYSNLYEGGEGGGGKTKLPEPVIPLTPIDISDFTFNGLIQNYPGTPLTPSNITPKAGKTQGVISNIQYEGVDPVYAKSAVFPALPGQYKIHFDVAEDRVHNFAADSLVTADPLDLLLISGYKDPSVNLSVAGSAEMNITGDIVTVNNVTTTTVNQFSFIYTFPTYDPTYNRVEITLKTTSDTSSISPLSFNFFNAESNLLSITGGSTSANAPAMGAETTYIFTILPVLPDNKIEFQISSVIGDTLDFVFQIPKVVFYRN